MRTVNEILAEMTAIVDGAQGRRLTDEEIERYNALDEELKQAQADEAIRSRHTTYNTVVVPAGVPRQTPAPADTVDNAFRAYLRTGVANADITELYVSGPEALGGPRNAMGTTHGPSGGYLVPEGFRARIIERLERRGGLASVVETVVTETGQTLPWVYGDDSANAGEIVEEGAGNTAGADIEFEPADLGAYTYQAGGRDGSPLRLSQELVQDAAVDIEAMVASRLGRRLARSLSPHLISGTGVKQPKGLLHGVTGVESLSATPSYDDLVRIKTGDGSTAGAGIDIDYWENARWVLNQRSLGRIWRFKDTHGDPIWVPGEQGGRLEDGMLLGHPITIDNGMPDFDGSTGETKPWLVFGDMRRAYVLRRVRDVVIVVNPWARASQREIEYTAWMRADGRPQDPHAYAVLCGHTP